ncbi:DUF952 domain-containing protein [Nocardia thailandica]|uniref:DUF952 domain-containing protein n=1 Tax=Nocardia thailandica TaxID=257275 RepID=A0ABW6PQ77_9NOCA
MNTDSHTLVHLLSSTEWERAREAGAHRPESLVTAGFVHLSTPAQVHLPADRLFAGRIDLIVLWLDPDRLGAEVRWEPGVPTDPASMLFPHLYGPLPLAAVVAAAPYPPGPDGRFATPVRP